jgi:hypothetical protein
MSSPPSAQPQAAVRVPDQRREIKIVSHSTLYYWWPVWAIGFLLAIITATSGTRMAVVPSGTTPGLAKSGEAKTDDKGNFRELAGLAVLIAPPEAKSAEKGTSFTFERPKLHISPSKNLGVLYALVLLLVIAITNIPLRGLWSVIVIVFIVFTVIILALLNVWEDIVTTLSFLDIRINEGGYVLISSVLFVIWAIVVFLFDKQLYMIFTPGQLRVRLEIGEGETAYDTTGMTIQKQRSDLFRHWILGLGSGDLIVRTTGAQAHQFDLPNVLFLGRKVREIEDMLRSRQVVAGPTRL